jgi:hypothetical protein
VAPFSLVLLAGEVQWIMFPGSFSVSGCKIGERVKIFAVLVKEMGG